MSKLYNITLFSWNSKPRKILYPYFINFSYPHLQKIEAWGYWIIWRKRKHLWNLQKIEVLIVLFWKLRGLFTNVATWQRNFQRVFFFFSRSKKNVLEYEERKGVRYFVTIKPKRRRITVQSSSFKTAQYKQTLQQSLSPTKLKG